MYRIHHIALQAGAFAYVDFGVGVTAEYAVT
jgi:hypothetical protein